jgi:hypothetical protein
MRCMRDCVYYLLTPWPKSASKLYRLSDLRLSAKLVPTSADRGCHVVSVTDPYGRILGLLDRICCVNPIDNIHYAPITTTPSTRTKYFTGTLAQSTSLEHSNKALYLNTCTKITSLEHTKITSLEHSHKALH